VPRPAYNGYPKWYIPSPDYKQKKVSVADFARVDQHGERTLPKALLSPEVPKPHHTKRRHGGSEYEVRKRWIAKVRKFEEDFKRKDDLSLELKRAVPAWRVNWPNSQFFSPGHPNRNTYTYVGVCEEVIRTGGSGLLYHCPSHILREDSTGREVIVSSVLGPSIAGVDPISGVKHVARCIWNELSACQL
jgi:hypothetical protein